MLRRRNIMLRRKRQTAPLTLRDFNTTRTAGSG
jgi:hypothetical protein